MEEYIMILNCYIATLEYDLRVAKKKGNVNEIKLLEKELKLNKEYREKIA